MKSALAYTELVSLIQECETVTANCEQAQQDKEDVLKRLHKLETSCKQMEREKNELIQVY